MTALATAQLMLAALLWAEQGRLALLDGATQSGDVRLFIRCCDLAVSDDGVGVAGVLAARVQDAPAAMQREILFALMRLGGVAKPAVAAVARIAADAGSSNRGVAVACLGWIGPAAQDAATVLTACLDADDPSVRYAACVAVWRVTGRTEASPALLKAGLASISRAEQLEALAAVEAIRGGVGRDCYSQVLDLVTARCSEVRAEALKLIPVLAPAPEQAAQGLATALRSVMDRADRLERERAAGLSLEMGASAYSVLRADRLIVIRGLTDLGRPAVPALIDLLKPGERVSTRYAALDILADLGHEAVAATEAVTAVTLDADSTLRGHAKKVLVFVAKK